jgi:hypothetical protein
MHFPVKDIICGDFHMTQNGKLSIEHRCEDTNIIYQASILRQIVAGPRARHPEAGLDLCYMTDNSRSASTSKFG